MFLAISVKLTQLQHTTSWSILLRRPVPSQSRVNLSLIQKIDCFRTKYSHHLLFIAWFKKHDALVRQWQKANGFRVVSGESKMRCGFVCASWLANHICHSEFGDTLFADDAGTPEARGGVWRGSWCWVLVTRRLSHCFHLFPAVVSVDNVFVIVFPTAVETISYCKIHRLLCTCVLPNTLISVVLVAVSHAICGSENAWNVYQIRYPTPHFHHL